jgi:hypothetical protein
MADTPSMLYYPKYAVVVWFLMAVTDVDDGRVATFMIALKALVNSNVYDEWPELDVLFPLVQFP